MPIIICLKEPPINLVLEGDIKDSAEKEYDELFPNMMVKDQDGRNMVIPLSRELNIAFIKEVTQEEIDEQKELAEKRRKEMERMASMGVGSKIVQPQGTRFLFPRGQGPGKRRG